MLQDMRHGSSNDFESEETLWNKKKSREESKGTLLEKQQKIRSRER
jgi:hypothetical protein